MLRNHLIWAYDRELEGTPKTWPYIAYPTPAWLIRAGEVKLHYPSGSQTYPAGTWIFPSEAQGMQEFAKGTRILSLRFVAEWPNGKPLFSRRHTHSFPDTQFPNLTHAALQLCNYVEQHFPQSYSPPHIVGSLEQYFLLQPLFHLWLVEYYRALHSVGLKPFTPNQLHEKVVQALQYLDSLPASHPLQEQALAKHVGLSLSQFNKIFHKDVGTTAAAFWNARRLRAAQTEMSSNKKSIKTIAYEFGFSSPANFTRWFRANSGITPTTYRQLNGKAPKV